MFHDMSMMPGSRQPFTPARHDGSIRGPSAPATGRFECHDLDPRRPVTVTLDLTTLLLARYVDTDGQISVGATARDIADGDAMLFVRAGRITFQPLGPGRLHLFEFRRDTFHALVSKRLGDARRVALFAPYRLRSSGLDNLLDRVVALTPGATRDRLWSAIQSDILENLVRHADQAIMFPVIRSVSAAMRIVSDQPARPWTTADLASAAGVTAPVLRRGFRGSLALTVGQYVLAVRLDWLRGRLSSGRESRSIAELARELSFRSASALSRAYVRQFDESPSKTRGNAVAKM